MKSTLQAAGAAALALCSISANAQKAFSATEAVTPGTYYSASGSATFSNPTTSKDYFFLVGPGQILDATVTGTDQTYAAVFGPGKLDFGTATVGLYNANTHTQIGSSFSFADGEATSVFSHLASGNYYFQVDGTATGSKGGKYLLSATFSVSSVPEPESIALMLSVLGMLGAVARRRKID